MNPPIFLNPDGQLLPSIVQQLHEARKTKPIWARRADFEAKVTTLEGEVSMRPGDYLCRGIVGEYWPQKQSKLLEKYIPFGHVDPDGWQRFDPKPDSQTVEAAQVGYDFKVVAQWGELLGKRGDFVVRSITDSSDVWIVDRTIFNASYEFVDPEPCTVDPAV